jgi:hexosaminidase
MGIQACVWTERIKETRRLEFMTFPRLAALAEAAWTRKDNKDYEDFLGRLKTHLKQYGKWGIYHFDPFDPSAVKEPVGP